MADKTATDSLTSAKNQDGGAVAEIADRGKKGKASSSGSSKNKSGTNKCNTSANAATRSQGKINNSVQNLIDGENARAEENARGDETAPRGGDQRKTKGLDAGRSAWTCLPPTTGTIPLKTAAEKRLDKLETLIVDQQSDNKEFRDFIMNAMSLQPQDGEEENGQGDECYEGYEQVDSEDDQENVPMNGQDNDEAENTANAGVAPIMVPNPQAGTTAVETLTPAKAQGFAAKYATEAAGKPIDEVMAVSLNYLMTNQLAEKPLLEMMEKYESPTNCEVLRIPKVNAPIWDSLNSKTRSADLKLQRVQKSLIKGMIANTQGVVTPTDSQQDAFTCLANANFELNMMRRELIKPDLNMKYSQLCKPTVQVTENLFGDDLSKNIKDLSEVHKATGMVMKAGRQQFRGKRFTPYNNNWQGRGGYGQSRGRGFRSQPFLSQGAGTMNRRNNYQYQPNPLSARKRGGRGTPRG